VEVVDASREEGRESLQELDGDIVILGWFLGFLRAVW
jgi:hypothetical protein